MLTGATLHVDTRRLKLCQGGRSHSGYKVVALQTGSGALLGAHHVQGSQSLL